MIVDISGYLATSESNMLSVPMSLAQNKYRENMYLRLTLRVGGAFVRDQVENLCRLGNADVIGSIKSSATRRCASYNISSAAGGTQVFQFYATTIVYFPKTLPTISCGMSSGQTMIQSGFFS